MVNRFASVLIVMLMTTSVGAVAARPATNSKSLADSGKKSTPTTPIPVDRESEAKANELIQLHLPELKDVLKRLRADQPREYNRAIRDLSKSARKLELAKNRDERLYDIEVDLLKAQNQVNLLTAKLKVRDSESDRKQLRSSAEQLQRAQVARGEYDVEVLRARLERTQQQLGAAQKRLETRRNNTNEQIEKSYLGMLRKAGREPKKQ